MAGVIIIRIIFIIYIGSYGLLNKSISNKAYMSLSSMSCTN